MSDNHRSGEMTFLQRVGLVVGILVGMVGMFGAWFVLPYRVDAAEKKVERLEREQATMREILIRIDENVKVLKESRK